MTLKEVVRKGIRFVRKASWSPSAYLEIVYLGDGSMFRLYYKQRGDSNRNGTKRYKSQPMGNNQFNWNRNCWEEIEDTK